MRLSWQFQTLIANYLQIIQLRADHNVAIMVANQEIRDAAEQKMQEMDIEFNRRIADEVGYKGYLL